MACHRSSSSVGWVGQRSDAGGEGQCPAPGQTKYQVKPNRGRQTRPLAQLISMRLGLGLALVSRWPEKEGAESDMVRVMRRAPWALAVGFTDFDCWRSFQIRAEQPSDGTSLRAAALPILGPICFLCDRWGSAYL